MYESPPAVASVTSLKNKSGAIRLPWQLLALKSITVNGVEAVQPNALVSTIVPLAAALGTVIFTWVGETVESVVANPFTAALLADENAAELVSVTSVPTGPDIGVAVSVSAAQNPVPEKLIT
jgi:hypothetical protein